MTVPSQSERDRFRFALEDRGVPEVIAVMAAQRLTCALPPSLDHYSASDLIASFFFWSSTKEGGLFWDCVDTNCLHLPAPLERAKPAEVEA